MPYSSGLTLVLGPGDMSCPLPGEGEQLGSTRPCTPICTHPGCTAGCWGALHGHPARSKGVGQWGWLCWGVPGDGVELCRAGGWGGVVCMPVLRDGQDKGLILRLRWELPRGLQLSLCPPQERPPPLPQEADGAQGGWGGWGGAMWALLLRRGCPAGPLFFPCPEHPAMRSRPGPQQPHVAQA